MKVIDLLNKIANGEEVPKKIKRYNYFFEHYEILTYDKSINNYRYDEKEEYWTDKFIINLDLNEEVEAINENNNI